MLLTDEDTLRIAKSLGLWRPGLFKIKTSEQWEQKHVTLKGWSRGDPNFGIEDNVKKSFNTALRKLRRNPAIG